MATGVGAVNLNINLRKDTRPEQLLKELALSPLIYIRLAGILFSIIVFGCVADQVYQSNNGARVCFYDFSNACSFAIAVGVIAFLLCLTFLVKDVLFVIIDYSDTMVIKKVLVLVDAIANGLWGFMWFVCFCFTADQWRRTRNDPRIIIVSSALVNCGNSGVAFSFFSIIVFGAIVGVNVFYFIRIMRGSDGSSPRGGGYASFPEPTGQSEGGSSDYTPPEY